MTPHGAIVIASTARLLVASIFAVPDPSLALFHFPLFTKVATVKRAHVVPLDTFSPSSLFGTFHSTHGSASPAPPALPAACHVAGAYQLSPPFARSSTCHLFSRSPSAARFSAAATQCTAICRSA